MLFRSIDPITRTWNEELVDGLFVPEDAELIKKIPLSRNAAEDNLYWSYSPSRNYLCKSGYRFLKEEVELLSNPLAPPIYEKRVWKEIWQIQAPPKIKNFLWRAYRNALPTKQALMQRKIVEDPMCERCKQAVEDMLHTLRSCPKLDVVWADQGTWGFRYEIGFTGVKELLLWMIEEGKSLELLAYTAWNVWNQRNKVQLNLQGSLLHQFAELTREKLVQYRANLQCSKVQVVSNKNGGNRWRASLVGFVKENFDGAIFDNSSMSGVGVVIRDTNGAVLASCAEKIGHAYKADETEALVALKALTFAHELGFQNVVLEGDALGLIQVLKSQEHNLSP